MNTALTTSQTDTISRKLNQMQDNNWLTLMAAFLLYHGSSYRADATAREHLMAGQLWTQAAAPVSLAQMALSCASYDKLSTDA